jgi:hypothetical protein
MVSTSMALSPTGLQRGRSRSKSTEEEAGGRLVAGARHGIGCHCARGAVGAVVDGIDAGALCCEQTQEPFMDGAEDFFVKEPAGDAGLVGDNDDRDGVFVQEPDRLRHFREQLNLLWIAQIRVISDNRVIPIEKYACSWHASLSPL